jgi:hypothetical protein
MLRSEVQIYKVVIVSSNLKILTKLFLVRFIVKFITLVSLTKVYIIASL